MKYKRKKGFCNMKEMSVSKKVGIILVLIQFLCTVIFTVSLLHLGMLPAIYCAVIIGLFVILLVIIGVIQWRAKKKAVISKVCSVILSVLLLFGSFYFFKAGDAVAAISNADNVKVDRIVVAVQKEDPAQTINDAADYTFGVQYALQGDAIKQTVQAIEENLDQTLDKKEYDTVQDQIQELFAGNVQVIILNEAYIELMDEELTEFSERIRIIYTYELKSEVELAQDSGEFEITKDSFIVYVSGIDVYGAIETNSRSDVNILAAVNPTSHKILLVTTPRDYYIPFPGVTGGMRDKLTHAGIYGIDVSMAALGELYDIDPAFYVRVNFTSLIKVVDALGGVNVNSECSFTTSVDGETMNVSEGLNHFNGKQALAFCRERKQLAGGDNQRGKNQEAVFKAIIEKLLSPAILTGASDLISSVEGNVETNMGKDQIQKLVKSQLSDPQAWTIDMTAATGRGDSNYCYSMPKTALYVMWPNADSVESIKTAIQDTMQQ